MESLQKKKHFPVYGAELAERIGELEAQIYEEAGEEFNINSPKQLGVILFEKLQFPGGKKTKTGYSTAADVLEKLAPDHKLVADILEYRQLAKLKSTYADGLQAVIGKMEESIRHLTDHHRDRPHQQYRSESAEHSGADGAWPSDPESLRAKAWLCLSGCRLFPD